MIKQYAVFVVVGIVVTVATILFRALIGILIHDDTIAKYVISIAVSYVFGMALSYLLHKKITFASIVGQTSTRTELPRFIFINALGMCATMLGSYLMRSWIFDALLAPEFSKSVAFAIAAFSVSVLTYALNRKFVFRDGSHLVNLPQ